MIRLTCPVCERPLYPNPARWTPDGWACANRFSCIQYARSAALAEEIDWLRSFNYSPLRIAQRLGVTVSCVEKRLAAKVGAA